jgi:hypothetical protein
MTKDDVRRTLTAAIDELDEKPEHLSAIVNEIAAFEFERYVGWRWWWIGIPAVDCLGVEWLVPKANVAETVNRVLGTDRLLSLTLFPYGIPNPEIYKLTTQWGPQGGPVSGP